MSTVGNTYVKRSEVDYFEPNPYEAGTLRSNQHIAKQAEQIGQRQTAATLLRLKNDNGEKNEGEKNEGEKKEGEKKEGGRRKYSRKRGKSRRRKSRRRRN